MAKMEMGIINTQCVGIDIGSRSHFVAVGQSLQDVKEFGVYADDLTLRLLQLITFLFPCSWTDDKPQNDKKFMAFTETEILEQLDLAFNGTPSQNYAVGRPQDINK
jgi:hypothetical protein